MKSNVFALAVALSLLVSPASALALLQSPDSVKPPNRRTVNGMTWTLQVSKELTVFDSIWVTSRIINSSSKQFIFHTEAKSNIIKFILTPQETVKSFRIDLRRLYGRLPAGEYSIAIHYPLTSYVVKELAAYEPVDLKSPVLRFKPPLSTLMRNQKWHPKCRWTSRIFGFCGTGLRSYVLEKGASVTVLLNTPLDIDGIYRYELSYSGPDQRNTRTAYSKPFVIRSFKVRLKATATK